MGSLGQRLSSITTHPVHNFPGRWSLVNNSWAALADWGPRALLLLLGRKENGVTLQRCDIYINKNPTALWKYFVELFHKSTMELTWSSAPKFRELMCGLLQGRNKANLAQTTARLSWPFRLLTFLSCPLHMAAACIPWLCFHPWLDQTGMLECEGEFHFLVVLYLKDDGRETLSLECISLTTCFVFPSRSFEKIHFYFPTFLLQLSFCIFLWARMHYQIFSPPSDKSGA